MGFCFDQLVFFEPITIEENYTHTHTHTHPFPEPGIYVNHIPCLDHNGIP